jgi:hypothetical protein
VVFWQTVLAAKLSSTVGTLERHEGFLPAFLTVHATAPLFSQLREAFSVYMFPQFSNKTLANSIDLGIFLEILFPFSDTFSYQDFR